MSENITTGPLTHNLEERSTMYEIPGVWHPSEGGKWSQNFETIMKLGTDDWRNGIWKKKYDTYLQRIFEEDGKEIYFQIVGGISDLYAGLILIDRPYNTGGSSDEESEQEQEQEQEQAQVINPVMGKMKTIMELLFENKEKIPEGLYLQLSNEMKELYELTS